MPHANAHTATSPGTHSVWRALGLGFGVRIPVGFQRG